MDSSTITFIVTLVVAFVFLRWFISSDDDEVDGVTNNFAPAEETVREAATERATDRNSLRRPVNSDMIEVVQSIAPHLSVAQIRYDLQRTGSVQETVDRFLSEGTLPFPPGEEPRVAAASNTQDERNKRDNIKPENLLKKYNVDATGASTSGASTKTEWSNDANERSKTLQEKKAEMILKARKRLEAQLKNEQDLSQLEN